MKVRDARRGGVLFGLLVSVLAMVCLVAAFGIYVGTHVVVRHGGRDGRDLSVDLPGGHFSIHAHDHAGLGVADVPVYPGARPRNEDSGGDAVFEWDSNHDGQSKGFAVSASDLVTDDPADKVVAWYRQQLPNWIFVQKWDDAEFHMELRDGGQKRIVSIRERNGRTHIGLAAIGQPASN